MPNSPQPQLGQGAAPPDRLSVIALPILFAASGCAALIYQIVWFEQLSLTIGASAISLGVLLTTYLGGMGAGSFLFDRLAARRDPLRIYALLELGIGGFGLAILYLMPAVGTVYLAGGMIGWLPRLIVAALCLLPSTMLMGATWPALARWMQSTPHGAAGVGYLYAANIVGGVAGSLLAAFVLLRVYDNHVATFAAVALNVGIAVVTWLVATRTHARAVSAAAPVVQSAQRSTATWSLYVATALSGMTALSAEVLWTRHLSLLFGSTVYTFALVLAVFLVGLGLGGVAGAALGRRANPTAALGYCQLALCAAMAWAAYAITRSLPYWPLDVALPTPPAVELQLDLLRALWAVLPAALLWGASFPLTLAAAANAAPNTTARSSAGGLYAANTLGAIVGSLLTTFVLVVWFGSQAAQQLAILVAAASGAIVLFCADGQQPRAARIGVARVTAVGTSVIAALALAYFVPALPPNLVAYGRFMPTRSAGTEVVYVGEGLTASIAVTREPNGALAYHNAGKTQASTYPQDLRLQRMLGHLTTLVPEKPRAVLVIGLGAGITAGAVSIDPAVERVVVAEIEPLVPQAAGEYFAAPNFGVVANPKVTIHIDDGRHYLATTRDTFDAITSDPLDPWVKGAAALYTREFWELCKAHLNDGGVVTVFVQLYETTEDAVKSELATFFAAFPNGAVFANKVDGMGYDLVLLARAGDAPIDLDRVQQRLERRDYERVAASLREVGIDSALDLLGTFAAQAVDLDGWRSTAVLNTDRNLRLQYLAGQGLNVYGAGDIFGALVPPAPRFPERLFTGSPATLEALRQRVHAQQGIE